VTIGAFDGIHRGHRAVIDSVRRAALDQDRASVVVTFFPHPGVVLGYVEPFYLTSTEEKIALLNAIGIDLLVVMEFTLEMSYTRAAAYVSLLIEHLRMREAHVGYDFVFGHKREGTVDFLRRTGAERGFSVRVIDPTTNGGEPISSTGIRQALRAGDVQTAARWLGRPFRLSGAVIRQAEHIAALDVWPEHAIPADGAYACQAWVGNLKFDATAAIGSRQIDDAIRRNVEVRLPGVDRNLEGKNIALDFIAPANQPAN
jgi:riboflavin kinase/FMN adenylyltransferase